MSAAKKYFHDKRRKGIVDDILDMIGNNKIKDDLLLAKLHIGKPFIDKDKAREYLEDLKISGIIETTTDGVVSKCR